MTKFTVASLNIAHARGSTGHQIFKTNSKIYQNLANICDYFESYNPDIIALQEVDFGSFWNGSFDHLEFIAKRLNYLGKASGNHMQRFKLNYGSALLTKGKLHNVTSQILPSATFLPPKGLVTAMTKLKRDPNTIMTASLHLDFISWRRRLQQLNSAISLLSTYDYPLIIMGDFNSQWTDNNSAVRLLSESLGLNTYSESKTKLVTFPATDRCLDWILFSSHFSLVDYKVDEVALSDHYPVIAHLQKKD